MMITETVLRTLGICGLVGAGTVAINEVSRSQKKKKAALPVEETVDEENIQECKEFLNTTFSVDSTKLEKILLEASYPQDKVKQFVETIKEQAAPEESTVKAEVVNEESTAPTFTVIEEPKMTQPNFSNNSDSKKTNNKKN